MKKLVLIGSFLALAAPSVMAAGGNHPMAGCGLGYVLFGHSDNSQIMQILAATTNGTSGNQTFGMTTGTSGCTDDGAVKFVKEAEVFAEVNLDSLRREMAVGHGAFAETFASLLGASEAEIPSTLEFFKEHYVELFPTSETTSGEMLTSLSGLLS